MKSIADTVHLHQEVSYSSVSSSGYDKLALEMITLAVRDYFFVCNFNEKDLILKLTKKFLTDPEWIYKWCEVLNFDSEYMCLKFKRLMDKIPSNSMSSENSSLLEADFQKPVLHTVVHASSVVKSNSESSSRLISELFI